MTSLQVIGAGLGRTGTLSMKMALEEIGFGPCHNMTVAIELVERHKYFDTLLSLNNDGYLNEDALKAIFEGFSATTAYPGCMFFEELMKLNPNAKVILTLRDSPEDWAKSARDTIFSGNKASNRVVSCWNRFVYLTLMPRLLCSVYKMMEMQKFHGVQPNDPKTDLAQMYTDWNNRVIETVPAEKLLIYNVKEGWKPLCNFLGVPIPDKAFPRVNSTKEWKRKVSGRMNRNLRNTLANVLLFAVVLGCAYFLFQLLFMF